IRRDFLGTIATSGLLAAFPSVDLTDEERAGAVRPIDDTWDMSWCDRLRGKSRAVFDSPRAAEGGALYRAIMWRDQHATVFGTSKADLTPIVVIRHEAIPLIMDDEHWNHIGVGKDLQMKDPKTKKWYRRNPFSAAPADASESDKKYTIPAFIADGGIVLACNLAFGGIISQYKEKDKLAEAEAEKVAKQHILPGVILQPSGFFAVLKAQDEGCKYMMGS
ncbi:MAG TPA: hypothetical protein VIP11_23185, partial [Gemmatimonadaceae bacterium]